jgi:hypothetical protein
VGNYHGGAYWDNVGRELLPRSHDQSSIASDDTPHHSLRPRGSFEEFHDTPYYSLRQCRLSSGIRPVSKFTATASVRRAGERLNCLVHRLIHRGNRRRV